MSMWGIIYANKLKTFRSLQFKIFEYAEEMLYHIFARYAAITCYDIITYFIVIMGRCTFVI